MRNLITICLFLGMIFISCSSDDNGNPVSNCDKNAVINTELFNQISTENYQIDNIALNGDCLEITLTASGCEPNNWEEHLVASAVVVETSPIQWNTKVQLINDDCLAVFQKTVSFDLIPLRSTGQNQVQIVIEGWNSPILYEY